MEQQWEIFVACTKAKAESHQKVARFWSTVDTGFGLTLILISGKALVTFMNAIDGRGLTKAVRSDAFFNYRRKRDFHPGKPMPPLSSTRQSVYNLVWQLWFEFHSLTLHGDLDNCPV